MVPYEILEVKNQKKFDNKSNSESYSQMGEFKNAGSPMISFMVLSAWTFV